MKMMKGIVAAVITSATFLCFGGVQVTKQYCDSNRDKAVQNAIESVQTALPSLVGAAVDNYMADNGIPTVQTNTVVIEKFHTNNVSTVTNRYVVTRETNIVQNVQTNITVNHSEEYRTVIDASDRIVSTNGNEITTIFAQNKKIERDTISTITTTFPSNLWSSNCGAKYDKTNLLRVSGRYNTYGYPNVIDQTYVNELHQDGGSLVLQGVFIPIQTYTIINGIINDGVTQYMKIGFVVQGGWTSISDGRTNYITSATSPKIGDVLISSKQSNYYYSDSDERFTFSTSPSTTTWTNLNDPTLNPTTYRFFCYLWSREDTSSQSDYFVFRNYTATSTETVHSRKVDELVAFGELPDYIAGVSANNIITNDKFKTQVDSALNVITAPVMTRATTAAQRAEAVVMNQEATVSNMSNYWNAAKSYYDSQVSTISGYKSAAVQAANNARAYESSAEAAASSAQTAYGNTVNAANSGIAQINERIAWFDQYSGKYVTVVNNTTNFYFAEDSVARAGVAQNAEDIASLESRVGNNIEQLAVRMTAAESDISSIDNTLHQTVIAFGNRITTAENKIDSGISYTTAVSNRLENEVIAVRAELITKITKTDKTLGNLAVQHTNEIKAVGASLSSMSNRMDSAESSVTGLGNRITTAEGKINANEKFGTILRNMLGYIPDRFVYRAKVNGSYIGDLIVNVKKRTVVSSNETSRVIGYEYKTTWPAANNPKITVLTKTIPNFGKSITPSCNLTITFASATFQSTLTGNVIDANEMSYTYSGWYIQNGNQTCEFEFVGVVGAELVSEVENMRNLLFGSSKYKSPNGTTYDRIDIYAMPTNGSKVAAYATGNNTGGYVSASGSSLGYTVHFSTSWVNNPNQAANYWDVVPAFTEISDGVLKLHFVPTARKAVNAKSGTTDAGCVYILEDFYWSDGAIYCVVASYLDKVFKGRLKCKFVDGTYLTYPYVQVSFPDAISSSMSVGTYSADMEFDSREGTVMGTGTGTGLIRFKTTNGKVAASGLPVMFPENPSMANMINLMWYGTYGQ